MNTSPDPAALLASLHDPLFYFQEAERFHEAEGDIQQALEGAKATHTVVDHADLLAQFHVKLMQAAWLRVEQMFLEDPDLQTLQISRDEDDPDPSAPLYVKMANIDGPLGVGEHPEKLDEDLQCYLNDMGRKTYREFHDDLVDQGQITRENLVDCAINVLGERWHTQRRELALEQTLPTSAPPPPSFKPRF